jgi:RNA polymerase sigma factor (sigma-70 family)
MSADSEKGLLGRARQGDAAAFGDIVERYQSIAYSVALQIIGEPAAAQDAVQNAFISAFGALGRLRSEDAFPRWLRSIVRNEALAARKERIRSAPLEAAGRTAPLSIGVRRSSVRCLRDRNRFRAVSRSSPWE